MIGEKGEGFSGTTIKDTWTKPRWGWDVGMAGVRVSAGGKIETTVLEQQ